MMYKRLVFNIYDLYRWIRCRKSIMTFSAMLIENYKTLFIRQVYP